jgi:hypothetical protein
MFRTLDHLMKMSAKRETSRCEVSRVASAEKTERTQSSGLPILAHEVANAPPGAQVVDERKLYIVRPGGTV